MSYRDVFFMPMPVKIMNRVSSITNAFVNGIIPCVVPTEEEIKEALGILGMDADTICCAYCGDKYTEWDHFRPLIVDKKPTGYISEIHNLVPSCGKCNQSKGNKYWKDWMLSTARLSPQTRQVEDLGERVKRLENFALWGQAQVVDFEALVGKELWAKHWENYTKVLDMMRESQEISDAIRLKVQERFREK